MRKLILSLLLCLPLCSHAQIFNFGFGDDIFNRRQNEKVERVEYKGGQKAIENYLEKHYKNPKGSYGNLNGKIVVACIVSKKGKVKKTQVLKGVSNNHDKEAVRVAKKMKFKPAKKNDKKVDGRIDITFPIKRGKLNFSNLKTVDI